MRVLCLSVLFFLCLSCAEDQRAQKRREEVREANGPTDHDARLQWARARLQAERDKAALANYAPQETATLAGVLVHTLTHGSPEEREAARDGAQLALDAISTSIERNPEDKALLLSSRAFVLGALGEPEEAGKAMAESFATRPTLLVTQWLINGQGTKDRKLVQTTCRTARPAIVGDDEAFTLLTSCKEEMHALDLESALSWTTPEDRSWYRQQVKARQEEMKRAQEEDRRMSIELAKLNVARAQTRLQSQQLAAQRQQVEFERRKDARESCLMESYYNLHVVGASSQSFCY